MVATTVGNVQYSPEFPAMLERLLQMSVGARAYEMAMLPQNWQIALEAAFLSLNGCRPPQVSRNKLKRPATAQNTRLGRRPRPGSATQNSTPTTRNRCGRPGSSLECRGVGPGAARHPEGFTNYPPAPTPPGAAAKPPQSSAPRRPRSACLTGRRPATSRADTRQQQQAPGWSQQQLDDARAALATARVSPPATSPFPHDREDVYEEGASRGPSSSGSYSAGLHLDQGEEGALARQRAATAGTPFHPHPGADREGGRFSASGRTGTARPRSQRPLSAPPGPRTPDVSGYTFGAYQGPFIEGGHTGRLVARERKRIEDLQGYVNRREEALFWVAKGVGSRLSSSSFTYYPNSHNQGTTYQTDFKNHHLDKDAWSAVRSDNHRLRSDAFEAAPL
eukprot:CAMPEP_0206555294 /NCGR_PEP_ID=MMETSP0325_2-20121206/17700_1 /ASSEMBLY_ACC=CAM_ASM_000347 /TAXON_ID=2866 /ORGANISM="Crypthecodinium cohnii, Strain Seligo" /LENGTH=391 /DNA_ID=CAMNT_0054055551 /DNA_START=245 /DNA_END=1420 /DNA_ORIENTATION=+